MSKYGCVIDKQLSDDLKKKDLKKTKSFKQKMYRYLFKRVADICCSLGALVVLIIIFPFIACAIKIDSKGPIFFSQLRVGQYGYLFKIYKLRTMCADAENMVDKTVFKNKNKPFVQRKNDPRVTRVGAFLRKYSIDELPQLFCVLSGKMSFIGPRPFIPEETAALNEQYLGRLIIKPGLTGLAQISGRGKLPLDKRMEKDFEYIRDMSPWLDIKILWQTLIRIIKHDGAL